jgi:UDP-N-acetylmuramoyl-tripeptide--D-alanyl-D-alanine ligase
MVLNVGTAHLGEFGSVDAIASSKAEMVQALGPDGWAVLNDDDPRVSAMSEVTPGLIARWSTRREPADARLRVWASDLRPDELQRYSFVLHAAGFQNGSAPVTMRQLGEHHVGNALATATAALALGLDLVGVADALSRATARSPWRMELAERADGLAVLNDAYNANPDSMSAALGTLSGLRRKGGRLIAVLGDMLELGVDAPAEHRRIGGFAEECGVDLMYTTGKLGTELLAGFIAAGGSGFWFPCKEELAERLSHEVTPADIVLLKASRGLGLETVADTLLAYDEGADR